MEQQTESELHNCITDDQQSPCVTVASQDQAAGQYEKVARNSVPNIYNVTNDASTYEELNDGDYFRNTTDSSDLSMAEANTSTNVNRNSAVCCAEFR
jgi:hypothetical protein